MEPLDLIIHNAVVYPLGPSLEKHVGLIGVQKGVIVYLGRQDEVSGLRKPGTKAVSYTHLRAHET